MSKVPKWHVKAVYMVFALALVVSLSGAFIAAAPAAQAPTASAAGEDQINTLRIYGKADLNAAFPYTDFQAPFAPQSSEVPPKDFIQWNPAYLSHSDDNSAGIYGSFYPKIIVNTHDAAEKVHLRQWYVPEYCEPSGIVWADQEAVASPDIVKEYTYTLIHTSPDCSPVAGKPGVTDFAIPISDQDRIPELYPEIGLDDYDADDDGTADIVNLENFGRVNGPSGPPGNTTYAFSPCATGLTNANNQLVAGTLWMDISIDLTVEIGDEIRFLDHALTVTDLNTLGAASMTCDLSYSGNAEDETLVTDLIIYSQQDTLSAGRHETDVNIEDLTADTVAVGIASPDAPPSQSEAFIAGESFLRLIKAPWYLQITGASETQADITVGRLVVEGESFFVDGAEYEIARIYTVCCEDALACSAYSALDVVTKVTKELIGVGDGTETTFGPVTFASCNGSYFADCDGDGDVDFDTDPSPDVTVYVDNVKVTVTAIDKVAGTVTISPAATDEKPVTVTYCYYPEMLKYITLRNGLPKVDDVELDALSVTKTGVQACPENLPVLPPFNFEHDIVDDTNIPDVFTFEYEDQPCPLPDVQLPDNLTNDDDLNSPYGFVAGNATWGKFTNDDRATLDDTLVMVSCSANMSNNVFMWVETADLHGDVSFLPFGLNSIAERRIQDVASVEECWVQEEKEPRFDTNLLEEKFCEGCTDCDLVCLDECGLPESTPCPSPCADANECYEEWRWINIETMPWDYTEMQLPEQPDITDPLNGDDGDYILVSSWMTEDSGVPTCPDDADECTDCTCGAPVYDSMDPMIRMKFVYDAAVGEVNSADLYVNDGIYNQEYNDKDSDPTTIIDTASLRVYGKCNLSAAFPYTTYAGPFDLTSSEAPIKDFIQWNPAYMDHDDAASLEVYGDFFKDIEASNIDANEKVHLRQWYVPKYEEPSGIVWYADVDSICTTGPSIIQEYTYMLLDPDNNPVAGKAGMSALVLPVADQPANLQIGLDSVDVNNDGVADMTHVETVSAVDPDAYTGTDDGDALWPTSDQTLAYSCLDKLTPGDVIPGNTRWIDISTGRMKVVETDEIRFLDHAVVINQVSASTQEIKVDIKYTGRRYLEDPILGGGGEWLSVGETLSSGRHAVNDNQFLTGSPALPPSQSAEFKLGLGLDLQLVIEPWYVQVLGISDGYANIVVGRLLVEGESFFVDGAEYEIARIHTCPLPVDDELIAGPNLVEPGLKYITIRNDLPKFTSDLDPCDEADLEVDLGGMSVWKMRIHPCYEWPCDGYTYECIGDDVTVSTCIPMLPPFNMVHDMVDDINIPEVSNGLDPDDQQIDNSASSSIQACYDMISERIVPDVAAIEECWKDEGKETRYDTNLLEEKFTENSISLVERWQWKNIETLPWLYTEFVLPALPDKPTEDGYTTGDYILVSSFLTEDTNCYCADEECAEGECTDCQLQTIRMKFVYDAEYSLLNPDKTGLYVNTINVCEAWPIAQAGGPYSGEEGGTVDLDGSASGATAPYSYAWDLDNDGFYDDSAAENPTGVDVDTYWAVGANTIGLKVTDDDGCVGYDTATVTITEPSVCPDAIEVDASPFLVVYPGPDCNLPGAMTNIAGDDCTAVTVWGVEGGSWKSFDVSTGAGELGTYGLDAVQAYVITHTDCLGTDWAMCCDYP